MSMIQVSIVLFFVTRDCTQFLAEYEAVQEARAAEIENCKENLAVLAGAELPDIA